MASRESTDKNSPPEYFSRKLEEYTLKAVCGREYVLVERFKKWLRSRPDPNQPTQAGRLLRHAYPSNITFRPIQTNELCSEEQCCLLVFSILLCIGLGNRVHTFRSHGLLDGSLPIGIGDLKDVFRDLGETHAHNWAYKFDEIQYRFCPVMFKLDMSKNYVMKPKTVFPFFEKSLISDQGATAHIFKVIVLEEFVNERLREVVSSARSDGGKHDKLGYRYTFAMKTFKEGHEAYYENEKNAFLALKIHQGVVKYLADYQQSTETIAESEVIQKAGNKIPHTCNILLEYGEEDLEAIFLNRQEPLLESEIDTFWKRLFEIADALDGIHNLKHPIDDEVHEYHGWHADIKPENILSVQEKLKLADPGFAKFVRKTNSMPKQLIEGGTTTYGAPEKRPGNSNPVTQTIDIWSLGCVFSDAATWVVLGDQGLWQYEKLRQKAIKDIIDEWRRQGLQDELEIDGTEGDFFHDGHQVLPDVLHWHELLRCSRRQSDKITSQVLDLVEHVMLVGDPGKRATAKDIYDKLKEISSSRPDIPQGDFPKRVMEVRALGGDEISSTKAPSEIHKSETDNASPLNVSEHRKALKSKAINSLSIKPPHQSYFLWLGLAASDTALGPKNVNYERLSERSTSTKPHISLSSSTFSERRPSSRDSGIGSSLQDTVSTSSPIRITSPGNSLDFRLLSLKTPTQRKDKLLRPHPPQTVWQAREQAEENESHLLNDPVLTRYFDDNRNIKFLVDNAESMKDFWFEATYLLETLVMKATGQDPDGPDLIFTTGQGPLVSKKKVSDFGKVFGKAMRDPENQPKRGVRTDMSKALFDILNDYYENLENVRKLNKYRPRNLTIIVLTDGRWEGLSHENSVDKTIISFLGKLEKLIASPGLKGRPASVEFVQFGKHKIATKRLRRLDDDLKGQGVADIIDTEPSSGDVYKMILGSFREEYDNLDDNSDEEDDVTISGSLSQSERSPSSRLESPVSPFNSFSATTLYSSPKQMINPEITNPGQADKSNPPRYGFHVRSNTQDSIPPIREDEEVLVTVNKPQGDRPNRRNPNRYSLPSNHTITEPSTYSGNLVNIRKAVYDAMYGKDKRLPIVYRVTWDMFKMLEGGFPSGQQLGDVLTLTGDIINAQARSCRDYITDNWPKAMPLIQVLEDKLLARQTAQVPPNQPTITVVRRGDSVNLDQRHPDLPNTAQEYSTIDDITFEGFFDDHIQVASAITWLCGALKKSNHQKLSLARTPIKFQSYAPRVEVILIGPSVVEVSDDRACWHDLFDFAVVATGFPIAGRKQGMGLEISFGDMISLAQSKRIEEYNGGLIIEGLRTLLIPIKELKLDDALQWHLEEKPTRAGRRKLGEQQDSTLNILEANTTKGWYNQTTTLENLSTRRAFLGWTHDALIVTGSLIEPIGRSGLNPNTPRRHRISYALGFSGGQFFQLTGVRTATPASTITRYVRVDKEEVRDRLRWAIINQVMLYDGQAKIAWLLPEAAVLLCMSQQWIKSWRYDVYENGVKISIPIAQAAADDGTSCLHTLESSLNLHIRPQNPSNGGTERTFSQLLAGLYFGIDKAQEVLDKATQGAHEVGTAAPTWIRGVELMDVALENTHPEVKEAEIDKAWAHLCEHTFIVMVCSELGQAISPRDHFGLCHTWQSVPRGRNYMVATVPSINTVLESNGPLADGYAHKRRLGPGMMWIPHRPVIQLHGSLHGSAMPQSVYHIQPLFRQNRDQRTWTNLRDARVLTRGAYIFDDIVGNPCGILNGS